MDLRGLLAGIAAVLALAGAACGEGASAGGEGAGTTLAVEQPSDGATVEVPFEVEVSSSVELGPPETGNHHVHLFFDGDDSDYEVVNSASFEVEELSSGQHTIHVSLHNADHSPAGAEDSVEVTVAGGGGEEGSGEEEESGQGGYDY